MAGQNATVRGSLPRAGLLNAWVDFNSDGDWNDAGERIFTDESLTAGVNQRSFPVPAAPIPAVTYARFRLNSSGGLLFTGLAPDGEVEDYAFGEITGSKWNDEDGEGDWDGTEVGLEGSTPVH